jgi:hypothetical protein
MEENFAEQIIPGTFIRVQAEGLIAPKGVAFGNVGIVGTAAAAAGVTDALAPTYILSNLDDAKALWAPSDPIAAGTLNLMRGLELLFRNGARTVYARAVAAGATAQQFADAADELLKDEINILVVPELGTAAATTLLKAAVNSAETDGRDVIGIIGSDAGANAAPTDIIAQANADKRLVLATPALMGAEDVEETLPNGIKRKKSVPIELPGQYTAAAVAGLIASLAPQASPTNKTLPGVTQLARKYGYGELTALVSGNVLVLESRQGIRVVRGITTEGAAFAQITTRRIVDYAKAGIRSVTNPFVGRLNNERVRKALKGALDGFLTTMLVDEQLTSYTLEVTATRDDERNNRCVVNVAMQPTFSIDYIRVTLALS